VTIRLSPYEEGAPGEDTSSPGIPARMIARGIVVQVGHRCPAVKVERPTDERP
jgi:hypothetical protein